MTAIAANPERELISEQTVVPRNFDGIVCFGGEDWWYHNRGHYDMQMMRELSASTPVLYINSIGMRVPRPTEGAMFLSRVGRKLRSVGRGLVRVNDRFAVFSALVLPGDRLGGQTRKTLAFQATLAAHRLGIRHPLIWVACPPAAEAALSISRAGLVYQRTDRFESFSGVNAAAIARDDRRLKQGADLTLFCSQYLYEEELRGCRRALFVDHGVDYAQFARAGDGTPDPADISHLPRPRVGFIGGIDAHTFDAALFNQVTGLLPELQFILVGACSLPAGWCRQPNVTLLGRREYGRVAAYMAACDVLIMPWLQNDWVRACNPVKLKEYLAVGRPVVTTWFEALRGSERIVTIARDAPSFAAAIKRSIAQPGPAGERRAAVRVHTWSRKARAVTEALRYLAINPRDPEATPRHDPEANRAHAAGGIP
jgi:glycosyltransferase involved in cell wall biosynthesis